MADPMKIPSTSELPSQVAVATSGESAQLGGLEPAGQEGMTAIQPASHEDEVEASRDASVGADEINRDAALTEASGLYNPAGQESIKQTADSLQGGLA